MHKEYDFIQFSVIHGHMPGAISICYQTHQGIKRAMSRLYSTHISSSWRGSPISLCPPGNLYCLVLVTCQGTGKAKGRCLACPLRTAFTTCILSLNSPAVVCNHRPWRTSIPKRYLGMGERYTVYSFGCRCPIPNGIQACFTLTALSLYPTVTARVPENHSRLP